MKTGWIAVTARAGAIAAALTTLAASSVAAQANAECRCVDRDGNEIERCSCFRAPDLRGFGATRFGDARPRIGVSVDPDQSRRRDAEGALVTEVMDDGPAEEAGIRRGDVITSIGGHSLFEPISADDERGFDLDQSVPVQRLLALAADLEPGEEVEIEYLRDGESRSATVEAEDLASRGWGRNVVVGAPGFDTERLREQLRGLSQDARLRSRPQGWAPEGGQLRVFGGGDGSGIVIDRLRGFGYGLELVALNPTLGSYFGVEEGVLVADAQDDSPLGLRPGDVVLRVGDREVTTPDRMRRILQSYGQEEEITLRVRREGREIDVQGRLGG